MEVFWEAFGEPWTLKNHAKVYNYMHFQCLDHFGAESVLGSAFGRVWHTFFKIWVAIGAPIGTPFCYFWQLFQGLILEAVLVWQKGAKHTRNGWAGGGGGAC